MAPVTPAEYRLAQARAMKEVPDLTTAVIDLARTLGWRVHHQRPGQERSGRWSSAIQGHKGFPDLVLVKNGYVAVRELKRYGGKPTDEQAEWLYELDQAGVDAGVWTTLDWFDGTIEAWLRNAA